MSAFSIDVAARLPGPEPLRQRRIAAAERLSALPWPSADDQVWRYSRIAELDAERLPPVAAGAGSPPVRAADLRPEALPYVPAGRCGLIITVDGCASCASRAASRCTTGQTSAAPSPTRISTT